MRRLNRRALAIEGSGDGLWDIDPQGGHVWLSRRVAQLLRIGHRDMIMTLGAAEHHVQASDVARLRARIGTVRHPGARIESELRLRASDGRDVWVDVRAGVKTDVSGRVVRISGSMRDITDKKKGELQLRHAVMHDELTGLPNRALLSQRLEDAVGALRRDPSRSFAVLYLDLDRFKLVNDSAGHDVGDQLLCAVARRVRKALRPSDFLARLGGDEFAAIVYGVDKPEHAQAVTRRIHAVLEAPFRLGELRVYTSTSVGIVMGDASRPPEQHLREADTAMYSAKREGAGANRVYRDGLKMAAKGRLHLESDLHRAVEEEAFQLYYQPIVELRTAGLRGFEALIRWEHPERGWIPPSEFIPIAEETGLIGPIGGWVLREACRTAASWEVPAGRRSPSISVNVSPREFREPGLPERVATVLEETGLDPERLILEITEGCMIDEDATIALLADLKALGVRLSVDDFGTGYSSLSYLSRLPIDQLKIDLSFVAALGTGHHDETVVRAIITLAHELEMGVTAEGIETPAQLDFLARQGCELGQGYLIGGPAPLEELTDLPAHLRGVTTL